MKIRRNGLKKPKSLKHTLILFMVFIWMVPILIFAVFTFTSYKNVYLDKTEELVISGLKSTSILVSTRLDEDINLIQKPSYERSWEDEWILYQKNEKQLRDFINVVNNDLKIKYNLDDRFDMYAFYLVGEEESSCYSSRTGYGYNSYIEKVQPNLEEIIKADSDYITVKVIDNHIFLIRNLYTVSGYQKYGSLVLRLNTNKIFEGFPVEDLQNVGLYFNSMDSVLFLNPEKFDAEATAVYADLKKECNIMNNNKQNILSNKEYIGYTYERRQNNYHVSVLYTVDKDTIYSGLYELYRMVIGMLLIFIPIIIFAFRYLQRQIEIPVERLVKVYKTITLGNLGTIVEGDPMPNKEFEYLVCSFNNMSEQVKYLFDSAYNEKLARKDAQITALQAQINPHFLNNTLEMMNWQARMSNDITVCKMIEALGTVLDHRMNRDNQKEIYLSEEIRCADAYLYIMSMRFGQRLQIEKDIDDDILWISVPQLILQPIIENAILHGIERVKSGKIQIHIYHDEKNVFLDVMNTGKAVTQEVINGIKDALSGKIQEGTGKHTSIGLRNVNERIKLVYGENYGLSVEVLEDGRFLSRITLPLEKKVQVFENN